MWFILYCEFLNDQHPYFSPVHSLEWTFFFFLERCLCSNNLLLLRSTILFRHDGVCSLQSVREAQSEAVSYRTEKENTRTGLGCWLWPDWRNRTELHVHLSGNVQRHAGRAARMCISSPSDIRVININTPIFCSFCIFQNVYLMHCDINENMDFGSHKKTQFMQIKFQHVICYGLFVHSFSFASVWQHIPLK